MFQPFVLEPDLPAELTRGDAGTMPVALYNYLPRPQRLEVTPGGRGLGRTLRLEDPEQVDERRARLGMPSLEEYTRQIREAYGR